MLGCFLATENWRASHQRRKALTFFEVLGWPRAGPLKERALCGSRWKCANFLLKKLEHYKSVRADERRLLPRKLSKKTGVLQWSFCLVWPFSLEEFPGPSHLLIALRVGKYCFVKMSSSTFSRPGFLHYVFVLLQAEKHLLLDYRKTRTMGSAHPH